MWTIFAYISEIFRLVWVYSVGLFSNKWSVDSQPCDIEAGIPPSPVNVPAIVPNIHRGADIEDVYIEPIPNPFLDHHVSITSKSQHSSTNDPEYECPVRRPSRRHSTIVPLKSRIVDATSKNIQDITLDKIKSVTVTCGPIVAVACSAQIEYFEDHIALTANVEWFDPAFHQPSYAPEIVYPEAHIPSSAKIEYFDSEVAETTSVEESSFSISSESAGFSSVDISSTETGYDLPPLADSVSLVDPAVGQVAAQDCVIRNDGISFAPLPELPNVVPFAEVLEAEAFSDSPVFMATSSMDSVAGRVPIKGGLKYSHRRYSTCDSSVDIELSATATNTSDSGRARIQDGIKYSHRRYSTWISSDDASYSGSDSTYRSGVVSESASADSTAEPSSESSDARLPSPFVLDGSDFVEDSAEWSSECVGAMEAVGTSVSTDDSAFVMTVDAETGSRIRRHRESLERVEYLVAQMDACFDAAFKKAGIPWVPRSPPCASPKFDTGYS